MIEIEAPGLAHEIADKVAKILAPLVAAQPVKKDDSLLGVKELAQYLGVSTQWVYERVQLKEIPYIKVGKLLRFRKSGIDTWLDSLKVPPMNPLSSAPNCATAPVFSCMTISYHGPGGVPPQVILKPWLAVIPIPQSLP